MAYDAKEHWENIYQIKNSEEVSWHQDKPITSLKLISELSLDKDFRIIDVGAGDSKLVDNLLNLGFKNITALDISLNALEKSKKRLGNMADDIKWVVSDLRKFETEDRYDLWHDRAVLHFLTKEEDINRYVDAVRQFLKPNGYLIVSTFSLDGPKKCSGLGIKQYSEDSVKKLFSDFEHIRSFEEEHKTPWEASQVFIYSIFRKCGDEK